MELVIWGGVCNNNGILIVRECSGDGLGHR